MEIGTGRFLKIKNLKKKNLPKNLSEGLLEADFTVPVFKAKNGPIYFTGEIVLQPKADSTLSQILKLAKNRISMVKSSYGTYTFKVGKAEDLFKIANQIYESGLADCSHPDFYSQMENAFIPSDPLFSQQFYLQGRHSRKCRACMETLRCFSMSS